jgi:hypothetical protein
MPECILHLCLGDALDESLTGDDRRIEADFVNYSGSQIVRLGSYGTMVERTT